GLVNVSVLPSADTRGSCAMLAAGPPVAPSNASSAPENASCVQASQSAYELPATAGSKDEGEPGEPTTMRPPRTPPDTGVGPGTCSWMVTAGPWPPEAVAAPEPLLQAAATPPSATPAPAPPATSSRRR